MLKITNFFYYFYKFPRNNWNSVALFFVSFSQYLLPYSILAILEIGATTEGIIVKMAK